MNAQQLLPAIPGYRIVRTIGAGGMGIVCEAENLATHETFALKVMHQHLAADPAYTARFEREVNALRAIRHPNVIDIYEWSFAPVGSGEASYVVMELLQGETLQQVLRREGLLPPRRAVAIMLQVLDGLAAAHRVGVLHRDLAPSNVFLATRADGKFRVKILDFGLARSIFAEDGSAAVTQPGMVLGKPAFAPPELFLEQPVGERGDIFSCGMMLFQMLTGRLPYRSTTAQMLWLERFADRDSPNEFPSPRVFAAHVPEPLADVVCRALRRRPEDRIRSAREFQRLLLAVEPDLLDDVPSSTVMRLARGQIAGSSASTVGGASSVALSRASRRRVHAAVAGILAIGLVAVVAAVLARWTGHDRAPDVSGAKPPAVVAPARDEEEAAPSATPVRPAEPAPAQSVLAQPESATKDAGGASKDPLGIVLAAGSPGADASASTETDDDQADAGLVGQADPVHRRPSVVPRPGSRASRTAASARDAGRADGMAQERSSTVFATEYSSSTVFATEYD